MPMFLDSRKVGRKLRVTSCRNQGGRRYMEDHHQIRVQRNPQTGAIDWVFLGVFDGHGGADASHFARNHLLNNIVEHSLFHSNDDEEVLLAIKEGFVQTHHAMWKEVDKWPQTASGYTSTSGTTASVAFIKNGKIFIGHVGDSGIVLVEDKNHNELTTSQSVPPTVSSRWLSAGEHGTYSRRSPMVGGRRLTIDHKPDSPVELKRIRESGGEIASKSGVVRVVWTRPRKCLNNGPIRRSTPFDKIPFLAVARSLGDLWSYNSENDSFVVSPEPDTHVVPLEKSHLAIVLASDGLWNVVNAQTVADVVNSHEWREIGFPDFAHPRNMGAHENHARHLVRHSLVRWGNLRADNITAVCAIFDSLNADYSPYQECVIKRLSGVEDTNNSDELFSTKDMLRIGPFGTDLIKTKPVELVYYGAVDKPLSFALPHSASDACVRSKLLRSLEDKEPSSGHLELQSSNNKASTNQTSPKGRIEFFIGGNDVEDDNGDEGDDEPESEDKPHQSSCNGIEDPLDYAQGNVAGNSKASSSPLTSRTTTKGFSGPEKDKFFCIKHGLTCARVKTANEQARIDPSFEVLETSNTFSEQPCSSSPTALAKRDEKGRGAKFFCKRHGLFCNKIKLMNRDFNAGEREGATHALKVGVACGSGFLLREDWEEDGPSFRTAFSLRSEHCELELREDSVSRIELTPAPAAKNGRRLRRSSTGHLRTPRSDGQLLKRKRARSSSPSRASPSATPKHLYNTRQKARSTRAGTKLSPLKVGVVSSGLRRRRAPTTPVKASILSKALSAKRNLSSSTSVPKAHQNNRKKSTKTKLDRELAEIRKNLTSSIHKFRVHTLKRFFSEPLVPDKAVVNPCQPNDATLCNFAESQLSNALLSPKSTLRKTKSNCKNGTMWPSNNSVSLSTRDRLSSRMTTEKLLFLEGLNLDHAPSLSPEDRRAHSPLDSRLSCQDARAIADYLTDTAGNHHLMSHSKTGSSLTNGGTERSVREALQLDVDVREAPCANNAFKTSSLSVKSCDISPGGLLSEFSSFFRYQNHFGGIPESCSSSGGSSPGPSSCKRLKLDSIPPHAMAKCGQVWNRSERNRSWFEKWSSGYFKWWGSSDL